MAEGSTNYGMFCYMPVGSLLLGLLLWLTEHHAVLGFGFGILAVEIEMIGIKMCLLTLLFIIVYCVVGIARYRSEGWVALECGTCNSCTEGLWQNVRTGCKSLLMRWKVEVGRMFKLDNEQLIGVAEPEQGYLRLAGYL